jgi:hypothetical protein
LEPKFLEVVTGRRLVNDAVKGTPLKWDLLLEE